MIRSNALEEQLKQQRFQAKTLDNLFRRRIEAGANCALFVSQAILQTVKDVFPQDPQDSDSQLGLGQIKLLVVAASEPAGKALDDCQKITVRLTLDAGQDDFEIRACRGVKVVPGNPEDSLVFQRITANKRPMPPSGEKPRPTDAAIAALKQSIEDGSP